MSDIVETYLATAATYGDSALNTTNFDADDLRVQEEYLKGGYSTLRNSIILFATIPTEFGPCKSARLRLNAIQAASGGSTFKAQRGDQAFTESEATWDKRDSSNNWATPFGSPTTPEKTALAEPTTTGEHFWTDFKALVDDAIISRSGILRIVLAGTTGNTAGFTFYNDDASDANKPAIEITWPDRRRATQFI